mmetsp:Transcript_4862/g.8718  ORF Transcript_4862/g.8718 Transcript_4862/m.8718 type:complete len:203 (-) Transcript_4862:375-983(-)
MSRNRQSRRSRTILASDFFWMRRPLPPPIRLYRIRLLWSTGASKIHNSHSLSPVSIFHSPVSTRGSKLYCLLLWTHYCLGWICTRFVAGRIQCRVVIKWRWCSGRMVWCMWVQFLPFPCQIWWWALEGDLPFWMLRPKTATATQAFQTMMMFRRAVAVIDAPLCTAAAAAAAYSSSISIISTLHGTSDSSWHSVASSSRCVP